MSPAARVLAFLVRAYQLVGRPLLPPACRFVPSCSDYALEALRTHGAVRGVVSGLGLLNLWIALRDALRSTAVGDS